MSCDLLYSVLYSCTQPLLRSSRVVNRRRCDVMCCISPINSCLCINACAIEYERHCALIRLYRVICCAARCIAAHSRVASHCTLLFPPLSTAVQHCLHLLFVSAAFRCLRCFRFRSDCFVPFCRLCQLLRDFLLFWFVFRFVFVLSISSLVFWLLRTYTCVIVTRCMCGVVAISIHPILCPALA